MLGCLIARGLDIDAALAALSGLADVPGRMQRVGGKQRPLAVIDYAHTPDALEKALHALRPLAKSRHGRLIVVFGAGGGRDASKRARMGEIAERLADRVMLTSDNPRGEDPLAILADIRSGMSVAHSVEPERAAAIATAIRQAEAADVVLIAGKGHEAYQEIGGVRRAFSDLAHAERSLAAWGKP